MKTLMCGASENCTTMILWTVQISYHLLTDANQSNKGKSPGANKQASAAAGQRSLCVVNSNETPVPRFTPRPFMLRSTQAHKPKQTRVAVTRKCPWWLWNCWHQQPVPGLGAQEQRAHVRSPLPRHLPSFPFSHPKAGVSEDWARLDLPERKHILGENMSSR